VRPMPAKHTAPHSVVALLQGCEAKMTSPEA